MAILKKMPVVGKKYAWQYSKIVQNARARAKLHVANLKKVPVHPQKMPVANYEGKFATGMKKCHGKKKHCPDDPAAAAWVCFGFQLGLR